jgi:hypothetical protein
MMKSIARVMMYGVPTKDELSNRMGFLGEERRPTLGAGLGPAPTQDWFS